MKENPKFEIQDLPAFVLELRCVDPDHGKIQTRTSKLTQPISAFNPVALTATRLQQHKLVMSSELFDFENYLQHGGFLNKKFWITNLFHGSSDNDQTNLYDVKLTENLVQ